MRGEAVSPARLLGGESQAIRYYQRAFKTIMKFIIIKKAGEILRIVKLRWLFCLEVGFVPTASFKNFN